MSPPLSWMTPPPPSSQILMWNVSGVLSPTPKTGIASAVPTVGRLAGVATRESGVRVAGRGGVVVVQLTNRMVKGYR